MITKQHGPVIFIDDDEEVRISGAQALELEGFEVIALDSAYAALEHISVAWPGIIVSDVKMPTMSGMDLLDRVTTIDQDLPVVLITGHGDISLAVEAIHAGAYDFIEKPADMEFKDADGNPVDIPWPPNLHVVDRFIACFGNSYSESYGDCEAKASASEE